MTKSIVIRHGKETTDDTYGRSFPPFLWLLRDAHVEMPEENGKELTPTEYLTKEVLSSDNPDSMEVAVRKALKQFFPSFMCKTLPTPSADTKVMRAIATEQKQLTKSFNHEVDELIAYLETNVKPKQVYSNAGSPCDGHTFATLVQEVAKAVNDPNSIPALDNTWKLVVQSRCRDVQEKLIAEYCTTIKTRYEIASKGGPLEEETESSQEQCTSVIGIHNELWTEIKEKLHKEIGPLLSVPVSKECTLESVTDQLEKHLVQFQLETIPNTDKSVRRVIGGALYATAEENRKRSREYCNKLFTNCYTQIRTQVELAEDGYTVETLEADIENLWQEYDNKSVGPEKLYVREKMKSQIEANKRMFQELLKRAQDHREVKEAFKKINANLEGQTKHFEKRMQAEDERRQKVEEQLEKTQKSLDEQKKLLAEETQKLMEEKNKRDKVEERERVAQGRLDEEKKRTEKTEALLKTVTDERDKIKEQLTKATFMKDHADKKLVEESKRHADVIKDKDAEITKQTRKADETKKKLKQKKEEHKQEAEQLTKDINKKTEEAKKLTEDIKNKTAEAEKLSKQIKDKTDEAEKLAKEITNKTEEAEKLTKQVKDKAEEAEKLTKQVKDKTEEAGKLTKQVKDKTEEAERLTKQVKDKTEEAGKLTKQVKDKTEEAEKLTKQVKDKTEEAGKLTKQVNDKTAEAEKLTKQISDKTKEVGRLTILIQKETKEAMELKKYIDDFENSSWFTRMTWRKRYDDTLRK